SVRIQRDTPGIAELSRPRPWPAQHFQHLVVRIENLHPAVSKFADVLPPVCVDAHVIGVTHLAGILTRLAMASQPFSIRPKYLDAVIARISYVNSILPINAQSFRPIELARSAAGLA